MISRSDLAPLYRIRVLIIDDSGPFCSAARDLLTHRGFAVVGEARSAASGVALVARLRPDAVLLDVCLPDGDGFETAAHIRDHYPWVAVLLTSSHPSSEFHDRAEESGARGFVPKDQLADGDLSRFWTAFPERGGFDPARPPARRTKDS